MAGEIAAAGIGAAGIGAAGIGAAGSLVGGLIQFGHNKKSAKLNYQYSERLAQNNYQRQLNFWNKQNEYNTFTNQMARMREAGLSPGLMYSGSASGSSNAGGLSAVTPGQMGTHTPVNVGGYMDRVFQAAKISAELGVLNSQERKNNAEAIRAQAEADFTSGGRTSLVSSQEALNRSIAANTELKSSAQLLDNTIKMATMPLTIEQARLGLQVSRVQLEQYLEELEKARLGNEFTRQTWDSNKALIASNVAEKLAQVSLFGVQEMALKQGIRLSEAQIEKIGYEMDLLFEQAENTFVDTLNKERQGKILDQEVLEKKINNILREQGINPNSGSELNTIFRVLHRFGAIPFGGYFGR